MSAVLADTSGLFALLVPNDRYHGRAAASFERLRRQGVELLSTSYVLVETHALLSSRSGVAASRGLRRELEPLLRIVWVDQEQHQAGLDLWLDGKRGSSLVDAVSFLVMRRERIELAWSYDADFEAAGFRLLD